MNTTKIIPLVLAVVGILGAQTANAHTWRYNAGYLQVVQDIALKGTHTSEFLDGYQTGMSHKGYVEAYSNMPNVVYRCHAYSNMPLSFQDS